MLHTTTIIRLLFSIVFFQSWVNCSAVHAQVPLQNSGFEHNGDASTPKFWQAAKVPTDRLVMKRTSAQSFRGHWSLLIENEHVYDRPISNNWFQQIETAAVVGKRIRIKAAIQTDEVTAANICIQCWSGSREMLAFTSTPPLYGTHDWQEVSSPYVSVPHDAKAVVVRAALTGSGRVWFDEIQLETSGPSGDGKASKALGSLAGFQENNAETAHSGSKVGPVETENKGQEQTRGICILSSSIGKGIAPQDFLKFAESCSLNLVVLDFAWISYHWPRTTESTERLVELLQAAEIEVAVMFRPRVLNQREADIHYLNGGPNSRINLSPDFQYEDSLQWGAAWGEKILKRFPTINKILVYNLLGPRLSARDFLERCREEWTEIRENVSLGHVGPVDQLEDVLDVAFPFLSVNRLDGELIPLEPEANAIAKVSQAIGPSVIPFVKVDWAQSTKGTTEDVVAAIKACEEINKAFLLWHYDVLFNNPQQFNSSLVVGALGGSPQLVVDHHSATEAKAEAAPGNPKAWVALVSKEGVGITPQIVVKSPQNSYTIDCQSDTNLISYLPKNAWGRMQILAISRNDSNRPLLRFPIKEIPTGTANCILRMKTTESSLPPAQPIDFVVHPVTESWNEASCNWDNQPAYEERPSAEGSVGSKDVDLEIDITQLVKFARERKLDELSLLIRAKPIAKNGGAIPGGRSKPDLAKLPPPPLLNDDIEALPWPHQPPNASDEEISALNDSVWIINNSPLYQSDENNRVAYLHGGLDIVLENGTPIYAIKDGWVQSTQLTTVVVADVQDDKPAFGWEYTHLGRIAVRPGQRVNRGDLLGHVEFKGLPHLHITKVWSRAPFWGSWSYVCFPNGHFEYTDTESPVIRELYLLNHRTGKLSDQREGEGVVVSGAVDIVAAMRERGEYARNRTNGFGDRLAVASVECTIKSIPDRKTVRQFGLDFRKCVYLKSRNNIAFNRELTQEVFLHWPPFESEVRSGTASFNYYLLSNFPKAERLRVIIGDKRDLSWDTTKSDSELETSVSNGEYEITVIASDYKGNVAKRSQRVFVRN